MRTDHGEVELAGEPLRVDLGDRAGGDGAGVGDHDLDVAESLGDVLGERAHGVGVGQVEGYGDRLAAVGADLVDELLAAVDPSRTQCHRVAGAREAQRSCGTDS